MSRIFLGIDPGLDGALAAIRDGRVILAERSPTWEFRDGDRRRRCIDGAALASLVASVAPDLIVIENCYGRRNDRAGPQSAFGFGGAWWVAMDRLRESGVEVLAIQPREWQRNLLKLRGRVNREDTKSASIAMVHRLFPGVNLTPGRCTEPHHGLADAIMLAFFGSMQSEVLIGANGASRATSARRAPRNRRR